MSPQRRGRAWLTVTQLEVTLEESGTEIPDIRDHTFPHQQVHEGCLRLSFILASLQQGAATEVASVLFHSASFVKM